MTTLTEADVEQAALDWLASLGWQVARAADIGPGAPDPERADHSRVILERRLRDALAALNPALTDDAISDAFRKLTQPQGASPETRNRALHRMLLDGVQVEYRASNGAIRGAQAQAIDYDNPYANDWLAVNQFTVKDNNHNRRLDIALFVNGLPLGIIELKNPTDENATISSAFNQIQTYKSELPTLFSFNELLIVSDSNEARIGSMTAGWEWFKQWRVMADETPTEAATPELQTLLNGVCEPRSLLDLIRDFIVFEDSGSALVKKMAGYHQFYAVQAAVEETLRAAAMQRALRQVAEPAGQYETGGQPGGAPGDKRIGVIWHTQGSGKSLTMAFFAGRIIREPAMENPTIVVLTDRNDLDNQLFATFSACQDLLRQPPVQAANRAHLRRLIATQSGGVVFTTIQKFFPEERGDSHPTLSARRNIIVIADEAHRSQYDFIDGFARHMRDAMPGASFIGFTGTPIELEDANTRAVFGDYISIYDIERSVKDSATVPIYYESRLAKLTLNEAERPTIDADFEEATEGEELERKEQLKTKWARLEAIVGADNRLKLIAEDIVEHFERRQEALDGKAMIVCMSRRICVALYNELARLRPQWHSDDDERGALKVIMTGSASDPAEWQPHIRGKSQREALANRFRDPDDGLQLAIVRDMWLTGFDAPSLHTMYADKPMRGHGLMQAIARVNRVFKDKPGGLIVDYLGLAPELKRALATYTQSGGRGQTTLDQEEAVDVMREKYEICLCLFHGFDWTKWTTGASAERLALLPAAQEHILAQPDGKERCLNAVRSLTRAFTLAVPHDEALRIRDDLSFFQAVQSALAKRARGSPRAAADLDHAIRQLISRAVAPDSVQDIFTAAGLDKPNISILSDEFLAEVRGMPHRNLAVELLQKLLNEEIAIRRRKNVVQARSFTDLLGQTLRKYENRAIEAAQVIEELIDLANRMRDADERGEQLGLSDEELAFYDAVAVNDDAVHALGDENLRDIAIALVEMARNSVTIDWAHREDLRSDLRRMVRRLLVRRGYPSNKLAATTLVVLEQAEALSEVWAQAA